MSSVLRVILVIGSVCFFIFILNMVRTKSWNSSMPYMDSHQLQLCAVIPFSRDPVFYCSAHAC